MANEMSEAERVSYLAYKIWESEGRPEGQQQRHWEMALKIVATERATGTDATLEEPLDSPDGQPPPESMEPLPEDSATAKRTRQPRKSATPSGKTTKKSEKTPKATQTQQEPKTVKKPKTTKAPKS